VLTQVVPELNFNWGMASPGGAVPEDYFSARCVIEICFGSGWYQLEAVADDGIRVWLDWQRLVNDWKEGGVEPSHIVNIESSGDRLCKLTVEYFEGGGGAALYVRYRQITPTPTLTPTWTPTPAPTLKPTLTITDTTPG
jgi:hypothetical protein